MFGIDSGEILLIALIALVVIGPKDLPQAMRAIGNFVGRARGMARHFRSGLDAMIREAELEEMEKKWKTENERIMREHPTLSAPAAAEAGDGDAGDSDWGKAPPAPPERSAPVVPPSDSAPPAPPSGAAPPPPPGDTP